MSVPPWRRRAVGRRRRGWAGFTDWWTTTEEIVHVTQNLGTHILVRERVATNAAMLDAVHREPRHLADLDLEVNRLLLIDTHENKRLLTLKFDPVECEHLP